MRSLIAPASTRAARTSSRMARLRRTSFSPLTSRFSRRRSALSVPRFLACVFRSSISRWRSSLGPSKPLVGIGLYRLSYDGLCFNRLGLYGLGLYGLGLDGLRFHRILEDCERIGRQNDAARVSPEIRWCGAKDAADELFDDRWANEGARKQGVQFFVEQGISPNVQAASRHLQGCVLLRRQPSRLPAQHR